MTEQADLDWKREDYNKRDPNYLDEAAKDIAAMANSGGGWIVLGIDEDGGDGATEILPLVWSPSSQQRLLDVAYTRIGPPVVGLEFFPVAHGDGHVVLIHIPDSPDAPHFARQGKNALIAPLRNGPHTVFMSDREIERGFRERFQRASERERQLHTAFEQAAQGLNPDQGVCLVIAALPVRSFRAAPPMTENTAYQFVHPTVPPGLLQPTATTPYASGAAVVRKGLRQWRIRSSEGSAFPYRKSLHDDGAVLAGYRLGALTDDERGAQYYPVGQPNHCRSVDVESALVDFMATLRDYSTERQINSGYRVRAGLLGNPDKPVYIRTTDPRIRDLLNPEDAVEPIHHFQPVTIDLDPLATVDSFLPDLNQFARDIVNQGGVLRLQRIAEPPELS
ncbi:AlbA family DNA-binding domain-containing protein [Enemella sp. A6]